MDLERLKSEVCDAVDALRGTLLHVSHEIHANPELAFEEHHAARLLIETLENAGLSVEAGAFGLETAFASDFGPDGAPCVALLAEYDALPKIGHACGHNLIATASVGAGLALATLSERIPGRVRVLGTPAEEHGGGKELMARNGALEGVDAALMMHPANLNLTTMPCIAMAEVDVVYEGLAAHASALFRVQRNDEAAEVYRRVLSIDPLNEEAHLRLGSGLTPPREVLPGSSMRRAIFVARRGRHSEAIRALELCLEEDPGNPIAHRLLGESLFSIRASSSMAGSAEEFRRLQQTLRTPSLKKLPIEQFMPQFDDLRGQRRRVAARALVL